MAPRGGQGRVAPALDAGCCSPTGATRELANSWTGPPELRRTRPSTNVALLQRWRGAKDNPMPSASSTSWTSSTQHVAPAASANGKMRRRCRIGHGAPCLGQHKHFNPRGNWRVTAVAPPGFSPRPPMSCPLIRDYWGD